MSAQIKWIKVIYWTCPCGCEGRAEISHAGGYVGCLGCGEKVRLPEDKYSLIDKIRSRYYAWKYGKYLRVLAENPERLRSCLRAAGYEERVYESTTICTNGESVFTLSRYVEP